MAVRIEYGIIIYLITILSIILGFLLLGVIRKSIIFKLVFIGLGILIIAFVNITDKLIRDIPNIIALNVTAVIILLLMLLFTGITELRKR